MSPKALDLGTPEHNSMIKDIGIAGINLSMIRVFLLYNIQQVVVDKIKSREHMVYK